MNAAAQVTEPEDDKLARLSSKLTSLEAEQRAREDRIRLLEEENAWLRARLWGRSSEKSVIELSPDQWQLVFNEAEARTFEAAPEPEVSDIAAHQRAKPGRRKLPAIDANRAAKSNEARPRGTTVQTEVGQLRPIAGRTSLSA